MRVLAAAIFLSGCLQETSLRAPSQSAIDGQGSSGGSITSSAPTSNTGTSSGGEAPNLPAPPLPPTVVAPCSGASASSGWQQITPPGDLGDSQAIQVDPINIGTIYVQMHKGGNGGHASTDGLYVSQDCGATWSEVPGGRNASDPGLNIHTGSFNSLIIDPYDSQMMYTVSNYGPGGVWKSLNGGTDWDQLVTGASTKDTAQYVAGLWFQALDMDPNDNLHLVAANHDGCTGSFAPNCIAESRDAGATWTLIPAPIAWAEGNGVYIIDHDTLIFCTDQNGAFLTRNDGAHWDPIVGPGGASGAGRGRPIYKAADGTYYLGTNWGVFSSQDLLNWTSVYSGNFRQFLGTGTQLFTTAPWTFDYYSASQTTPTNWSAFYPGAAPSAAFGGVFMEYDTKHSLLYSSNWGAGLWRVVTQ